MGPTVESPKHDSSTAIEHHEADSLEKQEASSYHLGVDPINGVQVPKGYYYSPLFLGSYIAQALGFMAAVGVYALVAPNLGMINAEIGSPDSSIAWVAIVYTLLFGVGSALFGRISDLFGRRWFFVVGAGMGVIGNIICSRAQTVPTLIGGMTIIGAASSSQVLFPMVIGELVPVKYRFLAGAGFYGLGAPFGMFSGKVAIDVGHNVGWRWIFYIMAIINAVSTACWYLFYHPPTFVMLHHGRESVKQLVKGFDYIGFVLFNGGFSLILLALSWGGQLYPWDSARVICGFVVGGVSMAAFVVYQVVVSPKEPYIPLRLFRNIEYDAAIVTVTVSAMAYYGFSLIWPSMTVTLYPSPPSLNGWKISAVVGTFCLGSFIGLAIASYIRHLKILLVGMMTLGTAFIGAVAVSNQHNEGLAVAMISLGNFFLGAVDSIALTLSSISLDDQSEIGTAVGVAASIRTWGGSLAISVFSTVLANRLRTTIPAIVPPAVIQAGLPEDSVVTFIQAMQGLLPLSDVDGLTPNITAIGTDAYQTASSQAYRTCFLINIAFSALGLIGAFFCADLNPEIEHMVVQELHAKKEEKRLEQQNLDTGY